MNQLESQPSPGVSQPPPERQSHLHDFFIGVLESVHAKIFAVLSSIYLTLQFLAILGIIPEPYRLIRVEPYRTITILVAIGLLAIYMYYNFYIKIYKFIKLLLGQIAHLTDENEQLKKQLKQTTIPKDPSKLIAGHQHIEYPDVKFAIYALSKKIKHDPNFFVRDVDGKCDARKNIIIGIDRGGAILGGLLAKNLGVAIKTLAINWANRLPQRIPEEEPDLNRRVTSIIVGKCLENIDFENVMNILLVDDTVRGGKTMVAAKTLLRNILNEKKKNFLFVCDDNRAARAGEIKIDIACILYQHEDRHPIRLPKYCVYQTKTVKRWLLWDTTREEMKIKGEEKERFDKCYELIPNGLL